MATKIGPLNQHEYLHPNYGKEDCCLCKSEIEVKDLKSKVTVLKEFCKRLSSSQYPLEPEIQELINKKFWEIL